MLLLYLISPTSLVGCMYLKNRVFEALQCPLAGGRVINEEWATCGGVAFLVYFSVSHAMFCLKLGEWYPLRLALV